MEEICECGKVHKLSTSEIVVEYSAFEKLVLAVEKLSMPIVLLCSERSKNRAEELQKRVGNCRVVVLPPSYLEGESERIEDCGEEVVVAMGEDFVISIAKHYAFSLSCKLFIFPLFQLFDWTFSCFARLSDGVQFAFYRAKEPDKIFVAPQDFLSSPLILSYLASKYVAVFDSEVASLVFLISDCPKKKQFFLSTLDNFFSNSKENSAIWTLIRLGQAMTFFDDAKYFFGGDRAIVDALSNIKNANYHELETIALKLVVNAYSSFFNDAPAEGEVRLSKHIDVLCKIFKLSPSIVISRLSSSELINLDEGIKARLRSYFPYLKALLKKNLSKVFSIQAGIHSTFNPLKKYDISASTLERAFAVSGCFSYRPSTIHLLLGLGYLDKLL